MKRGSIFKLNKLTVVIMLAILIVAIFGAIMFYGNYYSKEGEKPVIFGELKSIWSNVTTPIMVVWDTSSTYVNDKRLWLIGAKDFKGKGTNIFSWNYYLTKGWYYLIYGLLLTFWSIPYYPYIAKAKNKNKKSTTTHYEFGKNFGLSVWDIHIVTFKENFLKLSNWLIYLPIIFVILMGTPVINRILQLVTLETLGVNMIFSSLLIVSAIAFIIMMRKEIQAYFRRKNIYENELQKIAGEETLKQIAGA